MPTMTSASITAISFPTPCAKLMAGSSYATVTRTPSSASADAEMCARAHAIIRPSAALLEPETSSATVLLDSPKWTTANASMCVWTNAMIVLSAMQWMELSISHANVQTTFPCSQMDHAKIHALSPTSAAQTPLAQHTPTKHTAAAVRDLSTSPALDTVLIRVWE